MNSSHPTPKLGKIRVWKILAGQDRMLQPYDLPPDVSSMDQASMLLPSGAYTTFRTYLGDRVLRLKDHIQRLELTATLADQSISIDEILLRRALREAIALLRLEAQRLDAEIDEFTIGPDFRIRITIPLDADTEDIYLTIESLLILPPRVYLEGVSVVTTDLRRILPEAKLTRFIERSNRVRHSLPAKVNEAIMVNEFGFLTEGISSNFFGVLSGRIQTAERGVLHGITRTLVLEQIRQLGLPFAFEAIHIDQVWMLDEAFITSSSRGVLPICRIDQQTIGKGLPGHFTQNLIRAYEATIEGQAEPI